MEITVGFAVELTVGFAVELTVGFDVELASGLGRTDEVAVLAEAVTFVLGAAVANVDLSGVRGRVCLGGAAGVESGLAGPGGEDWLDWVAAAAEKGETVSEAAGVAATGGFPLTGDWTGGAVPPPDPALLT